MCRLLWLQWLLIYYWLLVTQRKIFLHFHDGNKKTRIQMCMPRQNHWYVHLQYLHFCTYRWETIFLYICMYAQTIKRSTPGLFREQNGRSWFNFHKQSQNNTKTKWNTKTKQNKQKNVLQDVKHNVSIIARKIVRSSSMVDNNCCFYIVYTSLVFLRQMMRQLWNATINVCS